MIAHALQIIVVLFPLMILLKWTLRLTYLLFSVACYLSIWLLSPRTWRAMHDADVKVTR